MLHDKHHFLLTLTSSLSRIASFLEDGQPADGHGAVGGEDAVAGEEDLGQCRLQPGGEVGALVYL